jgi:hypothetical protein
MKSRNRAQAAYSTRGYVARKLIIASFIASYVVVAYLGGKVSHRGEFFPVFNWSLFTYVSPVRGLLELHVVRVGDKTFDRPVNYFELDSYFETARNRSTDVKKTLERLVAAHQRKDTETESTLRAVLEHQHLSGHGRVVYEIRYVIFSPVDRWLNGTVMRQQLIARFDTGAAQ